MSKPKLAVSFSGGRTSAYMARMIQKLNVSDYEIVYTFANTGQEHEKTLEFVDRCDKEWGLGVVWLEAKVNPEKGKGTRHNVVTYETASRKGEPFEDVIAKYGIPNMSCRNHCTRETKLAPMRSYLKSIGFQKCESAIGIRVDEIDRINPDRKKLRLVYPLVEWWPTTKEQILDWWSRQPFDLEIPEHLGNCTWCWKKTLRKHLTLMKDYPEVFEFPERMEREHGMSGALAQATGEPQVFFRKNMSVSDIRELSKKPFEPFMEQSTQKLLFRLDPLDETNGCEESCEVY